MKSPIRYIYYPRTEPPPDFVNSIAEVFRKYESEIGTQHLSKGLTSDEVLSVMRDDLKTIGFEVEESKKSKDKIDRPVFFGENGEPTLKYEVDAYHIEWRCGLEIEAGQALMGNALYRDLVQALVMVQVEVLILAVPNSYKYKSGGRLTISHDYDKAISIADTLFSHSRFHFPYKLVVIGY